MDTAGPASPLPLLGLSAHAGCAPGDLHAFLSVRRARETTGTLIGMLFVISGVLLPSGWKASGADSTLRTQDNALRRTGMIAMTPSRRSLKRVSDVVCSYGKSVMATQSP